MSEVTPRDREEKLLAAIAEGATGELPTPRNRKEKLLKEIYDNGGGGGGGTSVTVDSELSTTSKNPVQNKVITQALNEKGTYSKPTGGIPKTDLTSEVQASLENADNVSTLATEVDEIDNGLNSLFRYVERLDNWTTVEFTLADFTYDENSGITYLRAEAPSGYEIAEIKGYMVLNKTEVDASDTAIVIDMTNPNYFSELNGTAFQNVITNAVKGFAAIFTTNINLNLLYTQNLTTYSAASTDRNWATSPLLTSIASRGKSIASKTKYTTTSFTIKTNVPYTNISEFYGKLQYRVVPAS